METMTGADEALDLGWVKELSAAELDLLIDRLKVSIAQAKKPLDVRTEPTSQEVS